MEFGYGVDRFLSAVEMADKADRHGQFLGLHAPGRFDRVVDLTECALMSPQMQAVYGRIRSDTMASGWSAWNPHGGTGFWRHLALREGAEGLVVSLHTAPPDAEQSAWLAAHAPQWGASGVRLIAGADLSDVVKGEASMLWGTPFLVEYLGPVRYTLHADAFFQVNREGAALLCAQIAALAGRGETLLDLYCGTGEIGLFLAATGHFSQVIGVEIVPEAVAAAVETARQNNLSVEFHCGAVEAVVPTLALPASPTIIVDPPRSGLHPKALAFLSQQAAEALIYVACRPSSLARDGAVLAAAGWILDRWVAVDMFPQTRHIEVVSRWVRPIPTLASPEML
jgi:23S rRNA (uracil1939-C5)-methyltransferase